MVKVKLPLTESNKYQFDIDTIYCTINERYYLTDIEEINLKVKEYNRNTLKCMI